MSFHRFHRSFILGSRNIILWFDLQIVKRNFEIKRKKWRKRTIKRREFIQLHFFMELHSYWRFSGIKGGKYKVSRGRSFAINQRPFFFVDARKSIVRISWRERTGQTRSGIIDFVLSTPGHRVKFYIRRKIRNLWNNWGKKGKRRLAVHGYLGEKFNFNLPDALRIDATRWNADLANKSFDPTTRNAATSKTNERDNGMDKEFNYITILSWSVRLKKKKKKKTQRLTRLNSFISFLFHSFFSFIE